MSKETLDITTKSFGNNGSHWKPIGGSSSAAPQDFQLLAEAVNNPIVYACVTMNADKVASLPLHLQSISADNTIQEITDHPLLRLLMEVNADFNGYQLWKLTSSYLDVVGRCYWLINRNPITSLPQSLFILPPQNVTPMRNEKGYISSYEYKATSKSQAVTYPKADIIEFKNPNLADPYGAASSPLISAWQYVQLSSLFTEYQYNLLQNRGRPDAIISPKNPNEDWEEEKTKAYTKDFANKFKGNGNGRTWFNGQSLTYTPLSFPPTDLAPLAINQETQRLICNAFGVPEALLSKDANYANMDASLRLWAERAIKPKCSLIEQILNETLCMEFGDNLFVVFDSPIPSDKEFNLKRQQVAITSGALSVNEIRALAEMPPVAGGDDIPSLYIPTEPSLAPTKSLDNISANFNSLLSLNERVAAGSLDRATAINLAASLGVEPERAKGLIGFKAACSCQDHKASTASQDAPQGVRKASKGKDSPKPAKFPQNLFDKTAKDLTKTVRAVFKKQRQQVLDGFKNAKSADGLERKATGGYLPTEFVPYDDWDKGFAYEVQPVIELCAAKNAKEVWARIGASPDTFAVVPAKVKEAVEQLSLKFCAETNATTSLEINAAIETLRQEIEAGLVSGDTLKELTKRVNKIFDSAEQYRAARIAASETSRAIHLGQVISAKESGVVSGFKLLVSSDACEECLGYADKEIGLDGKYNESDTYSDVPLPIHPSCRCTQIEIIKPEFLNGVEQ